MKKLGLIINPIAGMGGMVGLKGTDGVLSEAVSRGAVPHAAEKTKRALLKLLPLIQDAEAKGVKAASEKEASTEADAKITTEDAKSTELEKLTIITCGGDMGETILRELGFSYEVAYISSKAKTDIADAKNSNLASAEYKNMTNAEDTKAGASSIASAGADIIAFVGGDGTARDIYEAVGEGLPVLGIPAGVKIYSPVYAQSPEKAGELLRLYLSGQTTLTKEMEVLDINENDYRKDIINTSLFGYLRVPYERRFLQSRKAPSPLSEEARQGAIAKHIAEDIMRIGSKAGAQKGKEDTQQINESVPEDTYYIIGPGSTTRSLANYLGVENTLLGVDIVHKKQIVEKQTNAKTDTETGTKAVIKTVVKDATEKEILAYLESEPAANSTTSPKLAIEQATDRVKSILDQPKQIKLIITPTGGQGYLLGRGNQQISAEVIKMIGKKNIIVIATQEKLAGFLGEPLRVDTGEAEADGMLRGYVKVITGYKEMQMYRVE